MTEQAARLARINLFITISFFCSMMAGTLTAILFPWVGLALVLVSSPAALISLHYYLYWRKEVKRSQEADEAFDRFMAGQKEEFARMFDIMRREHHNESTDA